MIKYEDVKEKLDQYFASITPEKLEADLRRAGLYDDLCGQVTSPPECNDRVIKHVICSGREVEVCRPCTHMVPHEKEPDADGDKCTTWMNCAYASGNVRCTKV